MPNDRPVKVQLFESTHIRSHWDAGREEWFFSIVDVVAALTKSVNPTDYLKKLRKRDEQLRDYIGSNCPQVAKHLDNIYESGELQREATFSVLETVQQEGARQVTRKHEYFNLDAVSRGGVRKIQSATAH